MEELEKKLSHFRSLLQDTDEASPLFLDEELVALLESCESLNHALYIAYTQKAGKLMTEEASIKNIIAGDERVERLTAIDLSNLALKMAEMYKKLWQEEKTDGTTFLY